MKINISEEIYYSASLKSEKMWNKICELFSFSIFGKYKFHIILTNTKPYENK